MEMIGGTSGLDDHICRETEVRPASAASFERPGMDPDYRSHDEVHPWSGRTASGGSPTPTPPPLVGDFAWIDAWHAEQATKLRAELQRRLQAMPSGQRIRNLRALLGWTQHRAALELGVSMRTVIRHELGQPRTPWLRLRLLLRLRELESGHAEELLAYFSRSQPEHS